jgi:DNA-binding transcriptional MocR family regulator
MMAAIQDILTPLGVEIEVNRVKGATVASAGGFFTYLRLPDDLPTAQVVAAVALRDKMLRIAFGHMFTVTGDTLSVQRSEAVGGFARCIRLCWAWHEEKDIVDGIERLAEAIVEMRERISKGEDLSNLSIGIR